jgi:alanine dehydrogenase
MPAEYDFCRSDLTIFTYFHYAADKGLTDAMVANGPACFTYETLEVDGALPLLVPMSEVAGRMSVQVGAHCLEHFNGGRGVMLGGVPGTDPAHVMVLGGGVCGINAAKMACGMGANVTILDIDLDRLRYLDDVMPANCSTLFSSSENIQAQLKKCDLAIGAVLIEGARAPVLVPRDYLKLMKPRSVVVDIAVDQGGCFETTKATTHDDPTYVVDDILHYGVANMPGAVPHTSTYALTNATLPWVRRLARMGAAEAVATDPHLRSALNTWKGKITHSAVAEYFGYAYEPADALV